MPARYDEVAEWWDGVVATDPLGLNGAARDAVRELLGSGPGRCLDLACGAGRTSIAIGEMGWEVTGVDLSRRQLDLAASRVRRRVQADAHRLPFVDSCFDALAMTFVHTDLDRFDIVTNEASRVLRPGGRLVAVELHPCFINPFCQPTPEGGRVLQPGYRRSGWHAVGLERPDSLRRKVGHHHLTLAQLLNTFIDAGLSLEHIQEPEPSPTPMLLVIAARRGA